MALGGAPARAIESADGRVELHGHVETQVRAIDEKFSQELDLAQWYNILNLELDVRLLPSGWGPIDYMKGHVRVEGRYDAIYSRGFGLFPRIDTYGNGARRLPKRLRDASDPDYALTTPATEGPADRIADEKPAPFAPPGERRGVPIHDDLFRQAGGDDVHGTADDPARYVNQALLGHRFALKDFRGPESLGTTQVLGPWLPKNRVIAVALLADRANPFRGRIPAVAVPSAFDAGGNGGEFDDPFAVRFFGGDPQLAGFTPAQVAAFQVDPLGANALSQAIFAPLSVVTEASRGKCERAGVASCVAGQSFPDPDGPGTFTVQALRQLVPAPLAGASDFSLSGLVDSNGDPLPAFGGDFSGVVPCLDPTEPVLAARQRGELGPGAIDENAGCIAGSFETTTAGGVTTFGRRVTSPRNLRFTGGGGENPFRPAPDVAAAAFVHDRLAAQGLYLPSVGLRETLRADDLDSLRFDFSERERAWNRGASQQRTKELKEAYVDVETLDSRLWLRLGLQQIIWGKTEIFRTTDRFNPQDLALSSVPTLEESRIALWSARAVYSIYDAGPVEDLRFEIAANLDRFEPADLGACGEPYAADFVCTLTYGLLAHSYTGAGLVGEVRPESPWEDPGDLEIGGRIEWRWDRFSFALTDFYGFDDLPYADGIFYYDRAVDPASGRPVVATLPGQALGRCATGGQIAPDPVNKASGTAAGLAYSTAFASHPYSVTPSQTPFANGGAAGTPDRLPDGRPLDGSTAIRGGIGRDPGCLRPGGAPGFANAFRLDPAAVMTNALGFHAANQQIFAWSCLATVGIASALEPGACAWNLFASPATLRGANLPVAEAFVTIFAGDPDGPTTQRNFFRIHDFQKNAAQSGPLVPVPLASLNRLFNDPQAPFDTNGNGAVDDGAGCADDDPATPCDLGGFDGFDTRTARSRPELAGNTTLDSSLTNEQRALLGCGPFYGTRCDTSARETTTFQFAQSGSFGGIDLLNLEASVLVQSWLGFEGTRAGQIATDNWPQPGTIGPLGAAVAGAPGASVRANTGFDGGPVCTRWVEGQGLVKLPGCRGIASLEVVYSDPNGNPGDADDVPTRVEVTFEPDYLPSVDGCVIGGVVNRRGQPSVPVTAVGASPRLARELDLCSQATTRRAVPQDFIAGFDAANNPIKVRNTGQDPDVAACAPRGFGGTLTVNGAARRVFICGAETRTLADLPLIHPTAGCVASPVNPGGVPDCFEWYNRDLVEEFFDGTAQLFQNELAAFSHDFLMFLAVTSCDLRTKDLDGVNHANAAPDFAADLECFLPSDPYRPGRCSLSTPQLCANVKTFLSAVGVTRNTLRAAGNERFGRRTFLWHSGGEAVLRYDRQNVLGFATDFAEDVTKTSWSVEFAWTDDAVFADHDDPRGISETDVFQWTVSVDRPTFVHFLNPNRTFFVNMQWFVRWLPGHTRGFTANGPVDATVTFAISTGYWQDRLTPQLLTIYELRSRAGGVMPSLEYRFTDNLSVTVGMLYFFGRTQFVPMPVREFTPVQNRAGHRAYYDGVDNGLSQIRKRDEVFLKLRWAF